MWELAYKESCIEELMLSDCGLGEDSWESLGLQGDQASPSSRTEPWIFIGSTDAEVEAPILWPPDAKSQLIGKDPDARKERFGVGGEGGSGGHDGSVASLTMHLSFRKLREIVKGREACWAAVHGVTKSGTWLNDWTTTRLQTASPQAIYTCFQLQLPALLTLAFDLFFQQSPTFLAPGTGFVEDNFSTDWKWGMVWG